MGHAHHRYLFSSFLIESQGLGPPLALLILSGLVAEGI